MNTEETNQDQPAVTTSIFVCGRKRVSCSSHDCGRRAVRLCCFPVKRNGVQLQCERPVCDGCLVVVEGREYCAAHGRVMVARSKKS